MRTPRNTVAPVVTIDLINSAILTTTDGSWDNFDGSITYQWYSGGVLVIGATSNTYVKTVNDVNSDIYCEVTATNTDNTASTTIVSTIEYNTPVTPDAPLITEENNETNTFAWTTTGTTELSTDNGSTWTDQTSPYDVGNVDIPAGELQVRVKAEGVNPASAVTVSTIAFTSSELIIQTDDGLTANANTYVNVETYEAYWLARGMDISAMTKEQKEASLILGWQYVDTRFEYCGKRLNGRTQTTEFPRTDLEDCEGDEITGIPFEIKNAQMEYAKRELDGVTLQDDSSATGNIKRIKNKIDVIEEEIEYQPALSGGEVKNYPTADKKIPSYFICDTGGEWGHN